MIFRRLFSFSTSLLISYSSFAQNLIPNQGFEDHKNCLGFNTELSVWYMPLGRFYHYLSDCPVGKAQFNGEDLNKPYAGDCFAGICLKSNEAGEHMAVKLDEPLKSNEEYIFSGYILLAAEFRKNFNNFEQIQIALTEKGYDVTKPSYIFFDAQITIPVSFQNRENEWIYISGRFTAKGNETYLTIGSFLEEKPISNELNEYMSLSSEERERYLNKHRRFESEMNEFNSNQTKVSKPYSIRCYFDELCLMSASDTVKGLCNYPIRLPAPALEIEALKPIVIKNIFFETGKSELLPQSFQSLDSLADWLIKNPNIEIQITGHTDNKGNEQENNKLSADRAGSVKKYLLSKGATNSMSSSGMGSTKPISENETDAGRSKNRRVEFTILKQ